MTSCCRLTWITIFSMICLIYIRILSWNWYFDLELWLLLMSVLTFVLNCLLVKFATFLILKCRNILTRYFSIGVCLQIKSFWTVLWLTVTSRNSSSSCLTVNISWLFLLWSFVYTSLFMYFSPFLHLSPVLFLLSLNFCSLDIHYLPQHLPLICIWLHSEMRVLLSLVFCPWFCSLLLYFSCLVYMFIEWRKKALLSFECLFVSYCNVLVLGNQAFAYFRLCMNNILWLKDKS